MKKYQDSKVEFTMQTLSESERQVTFKGKSTSEGTEHFIQWIESEIQAANDGSLNIIMDLRSLTATPIRVQLRMGAWLLTIKNNINKVALIGGGRTAKALAKGAKMTNVHFFSDLPKARQWLTQ